MVGFQSPQTKRARMNKNISITSVTLLRILWKQLLLCGVQKHKSPQKSEAVIFVWGSGNGPHSRAGITYLLHEDLNHISKRRRAEESKRGEISDCTLPFTVWNAETSGVTSDLYFYKSISWFSSIHSLFFFCFYVKNLYLRTRMGGTQFVIKWIMSEL